jgi:hypothetical protein
MNIPAQPPQDGLKALLDRRLFDVLWHRRTHRVSRGASVKAGSMSYVSPHKAAPLSELEEAVLIAITGCSGLTMPDRPFQDPVTGKLIMAKPNLGMAGRTAGSPDNAQGTHFFLINDTGTYFLKNLPPLEAEQALTPELLLERARQAKVKVLDRRLDAANREFPAYLDSNRFLSNLQGTTVFLPVVDLSHQYINGLMYLLTQPDGARPTLVDDRNFYRPAGVKRWVTKGFLNKDLKLPLGTIGTLRTQIEADLLLQNLMLVAEAMGLGAWIHATIGPPVMMGDPRYAGAYGKMLGFKFVAPKWRLLDALRWQLPLPKLAIHRTHPIGLEVEGEALMKAKCPPNYASMSDAVDAVIKAKFGQGGVYKDADTFAKIYKEPFGATYLKEAGEYGGDVIECVRDVCTYIYETHGRFPAHVDAIHVPGVWLQVHHVETEYYDRFFRNGLTNAHREHDRIWHSNAPSSVV